MSMRILTLAWSALHRDWRGGELGVLATALLISVASVSSVGFFTDRVRLVMERQGAELQAADLVVDSHQPLPVELLEGARRIGLDSAQSQAFRSVLLAGERTELAEVKAVGGAYPLRGSLRVSDRMFGVERTVVGGPPPGQAWLEQRLLQALELRVGDRVGVGAIDLRIAAVLTFEPDRGGEMFAIAPRLMMSLADVPMTQLVQPGSHLHYRLMLAGPGERIGDYRRWALGELQPGQHLRGLQDARPELRTALHRAGQFLGLAAMVSVVLAGVAIAVAARRFADRHRAGVAVMRCLGATQGLITRILVVEMTMLGLVAGLVGGAAGFLAQQLLAEILGQVVAGDLPAPSLWPLFPALVTGLVALLGFGLPPILRLRDVAPVRVLREDLGGWGRSSVWTYLIAVAGVAALMLWQAGDTGLAAWVLAGCVVTLLVLAVAAWLLVRGLGHLRGKVGVAWRFGLANIARRRAGTVVQVVALGLGIMVLLVLTLVRTDLLSAWRASLPPGAPNFFLINIQPGEVEPLQAFLGARGVETAGLFPMVRGRLTTINGSKVTPEAYQNPRARRLAEREFNLSWADALQVGNRLVAGRWWQQGDDQAQISIERDIAETLGIRLGDSLRFLIAGVAIEAPVTSLREVKWDTFRPNFFVLFPRGVLDDYPGTWITSFYLGDQRQQLLTELVRAFPSVTVLDVDALMVRVRGIIDRVALAVEFVFGFTVLAGLVVLYAAVQATRDERIRESAVLRTLGAGRRVVIGSLLAEFATLGLLSGVVAALAASVLGYGLGEFLFGFGYRLDPLLWLLGAVFGIVGVSLAGLSATRGVLNQPPIAVLRSDT